MNPLQFLNLVKEKGGGVFILEGEEEFFKLKTLETLKEDLPSPELNWIIFYGDRIEEENLFSLLLSYPFLSPCRYIILKQGEKLPSSLLKKLKERISQIPSTNYLFSLLSKKDSRWRELSPPAVITTWNKPTPEEIKSWVKEKLLKNHKKIKENALEILLERTKDNLPFLENEVEKLICFSGDKEWIEAEDIEKVGSEGSIVTIYHLLESILEGNFPQALLQLKKLLLRGTSALEILGYITWEFKRLWSFKSLKEKGMGSYFIALELGLRKETQRRYEKFLSSGKGMEWKELMEKIFQCDLALKRGRDPEIELGILLFYLCG